MEKTLIISAPFGGDTTSPSLGLGYLNSALKKRGFATSVLDINIELFCENKKRFNELFERSSIISWEQGEKYHELLGELAQFSKRMVERIVAVKPDIICFSIHRGSLLYTAELIRMIRQRLKKVYIVCGGPSTNIKGEMQFFKNGLADIFINTNDIEKVPDVIIDRKYEKYEAEEFQGKNIINIRNEDRDLNRRAFPDFSDFDLKKYTDERLPIIGSEGCIRNCAFCDELQYQRKLLHRDGKNTAEEIRHELLKLGIRKFEFNDLECNADLKELEKFCDKVIKYNAKISWSSNAIIRNGMDKSLMQKMKKSGCTFLRVGLESGSDAVLKKMGKGITKKTAEEFLRNTKSAGIQTHVNVIVGFPGETEKDFQETLDFLDENKENITIVSNIFECLISPNSRLEKNPEGFGVTYPRSENYWFLWEDKAGNNHESRRKRLKKSFEFMKRNKITHLPPNVTNNKSVLFN